MKHLLSIEKLSRDDILSILRATGELKKKRALIGPQPLAGQTWALIFSKPSTRRQTANRFLPSRSMGKHARLVPSR